MSSDPVSYLSETRDGLWTPTRMIYRNTGSISPRFNLYYLTTLADQGIIERGPLTRLGSLWRKRG